MFNATMDFGLGEDIDALRETVRKFALEVIAPKSLPENFTLSPIQSHVRARPFESFQYE